MEIVCIFIDVVVSPREIIVDLGKVVVVKHEVNAPATGAKSPICRDFNLKNLLGVFGGSRAPSENNRIVSWPNGSCARSTFPRIRSFPSTAILETIDQILSILRVDNL